MIGSAEAAGAAASHGRRALVTGGAGFIGSTLARTLADDHWTVTAVDRFTDYYSPELKRANAAWAATAGVSLIEADLVEADLSPLLVDIDVVFHLAGQPGVRSSWGESFHEYTRANIDATQRLLEACVRLDSPPRFVYASSSSVYGDAERFPTRESDTPAPISPYGVTKLAGEHLVRLYARLHGLDAVVLRYFSVYGPRQRPDMGMHRFFEAALAGKPITVFGDGTQVREFTYVGDVVSASIAAAEAAVERGVVLNVAGGASVTVNEIIDHLGELLGGRPVVEYIPGTAGEARRTGGSIELISERLGWKPTTEIEDGLLAQLNWHQAP